MRVGVFADSDGDYGMGHIVRQVRLADVMSDRGAYFNFFMNENQTRGKKLASEYKIRERGLTMWQHDCIIVDVMNNDDNELRRLRQWCERLIVFVGAGHTITPDTYWIADMVIWQHALSSAPREFFLPELLAHKEFVGDQWLILDPVLRGRPEVENREQVSVYFGGGVDVASFLPKLPTMFIDHYFGHPWTFSPGAELLKSRTFFGTMGMMAYEAMAAGLRPILVSRSEDHLETAEALERKHLAYSLGLASEWNKERAAELDELMVLTDRLPEYARPDGWGAWRIADRIL